MMECFYSIWIIKIFKFNNNLFLTLWRLLCLPVYSWSSLQHWWQVDTWLSRAGRVSHLITVQLHSWLYYYIYIKWAMTLWLTDWLAEFTTVQQYVCSIFCCCYSHSYTHVLVISEMKTPKCSQLYDPWYDV